MATTTQILFGERERTLRYDIAAMLALEEAMGGKSTGDILASLASWNFTALVLVLWAGLKHEDRALTIALTRRYLERYVTQPGANLKQLRKDVSEAIHASQWFQQIAPDDDADDGAEEGSEGNA